MEHVKVVVVGEGAVGKTSLILRAETGIFPTDYIPSVADTTSSTVEHNGRSYSVSLWDVAAQADYDRLRPLSYPQTDVFLLCYSLVSHGSLEALQSRWLPEVQEHVPEARLLVCATKADLLEDEAMLAALAAKDLSPVAVEEGEAVALRLGAAGHVMTSAVTGAGMEALMPGIITAAVGPPKKKKRCVLTSTVVEARGLADDGPHLTAARRLRDEWLRDRPGGAALIAAYEALAPRLLAALDQRSVGEREAVHDQILATVEQCRVLIEADRPAEAARTYATMVGRLSEALLPDEPVHVPGWIG